MFVVAFGCVHVWCMMGVHAEKNERFVWLDGIGCVHYTCMMFSVVELCVLLVVVNAFVVVLTFFSAGFQRKNFPCSGKNLFQKR